MASGSKSSYGVSLAVAQENLELWIEASKQVLTHQSYKLGSRELVLADLKEIQSMIEYWSDAVDKAQARQNRRAQRAILRDL